MDFMEYTKSIYRSKLNIFESLDFKSLSAREQRAYLCEASAMKKFMYDNLDDGYEYTFNVFVNDLDVINRLNRFLEKGFSLLPGGDDEKCFYLSKNPVRIRFDKSGGTCVFTLDEYLEKMARIGMHDVDMTIVNRYPEWMEKTALIMDEMCRYINWVIESVPQKKFLCLLRDTMLIFLSLKKKGFHDTVPVIVGRKYLKQYDDAFFDDPIMNVLYETLQYDKPVGADVAKRYRARFAQHNEERVKNVAGTVKAYLDRTLRGGGYTAVESGIQGTMPLFLQAIDDRIDGFLMYTTFPWLLDNYRGMICQENYHYLREMETLACHDDLFEFAGEKDGVIYVREYQDEIVKNLAYYEIAKLMEMI